MDVTLTRACCEGFRLPSTYPRSDHPIFPEPWKSAGELRQNYVNGHQRHHIHPNAFHFLRFGLMNVIMCHLSHQRLFVENDLLGHRACLNRIELLLQVGLYVFLPLLLQTRMMLRPHCRPLYCCQSIHYGHRFSWYICVYRNVMILQLAR